MSLNFPGSLLNGFLVVTVLAVVASTGVPSPKRSIDAAAENSTPDGKYFVFASAADDLVAEDTNNLKDIFLRDSLTGITSRISKGLFDVEPNGESGSPVISANGRYVVYNSQAKNLVVGDTNEKGDIFIYDRKSGTTDRAKLMVENEPFSDQFKALKISDDGHIITLSDQAKELLYQHNRVTGEITNIK